MGRSLISRSTTPMRGFNESRLSMIGAKTSSGVSRSKVKARSSAHVLSGISLRVSIVPKLVMNSIVLIGDRAL